MGELGEFRRDGDRVEGGAGKGEEGVGGETGAGAMGAPFVIEESGVGVDVGELSGVAGAGGVGAVLGVGAVEVLGPEAVEDEGGVLGALGGGGVGVAELGRPGEIEEEVVEVLWAGGCGDGAGLFVALLAGLGGWCGLLWIAAQKQGEEKEGRGDGFVSCVHRFSPLSRHSLRG